VLCNLSAVLFPLFLPTLHERLHLSPPIGIKEERRLFAIAIRPFLPPSQETGSRALAQSNGKLLAFLLSNNVQRQLLAGFKIIQYALYVIDVPDRPAIDLDNDIARAQVSRTARMVQKKETIL